MQLSFLQQFLIEFDYPYDAQTSLISYHEKIINSPELSARFDETIHAYEQSIQCNFDLLLPKIKNIFAKAAVHEYSAYLLFLIELTPVLKKYYYSHGFDETIWRTTVLDWKYKAVECKLITFV